MSQTRVPCNCNKCGLAFTVVYEIEKPGPLTWSTVACPRRTCKNVVRVPIPQNASFTVDAPLAAPGPAEHETPPPTPAAARPAPAPRGPDPFHAVEPAPQARELEGPLEKSEAQACSSCGHSFTLRYKYLDADAESVIWVQCPNCGASLQVWVLEGAYDIQL